MAFVNEYISKEDFEKYGLAEIDKKFVVGGVKAKHWTIDREREVYLRKVANGREERQHISSWILLWKGVPLQVEIHLINASGNPGGACSAYKRVERLNCLGEGILPPHYVLERKEILRALEEALLVYKDAGVVSACNQYSLVLDVAQGVQNA